MRYNKGDEKKKKERQIRLEWIRLFIGKEKKMKSAIPEQDNARHLSDPK